MFGENMLREVAMTMRLLKYIPEKALEWKFWSSHLKPFFILTQHIFHGVIEERRTKWDAVADSNHLAKDEKYLCLTWDPGLI